MQNDRQITHERRTVKAGSLHAHEQQPQRGQAHRTRTILVILLDATGSMKPFIEGVLRALQHMLDILIQGALEPLVGMVMFRDELEGERPEVYEIGTPSQELKQVLDGVQATGGGDEPESSYPAIMRAIGLLETAEPQMPRVFLHITDAPPHDPEGDLTARSMLEALKREHVIFFACTHNEEPYRTFANATGGTLFPFQKNVSPEPLKPCFWISPEPRSRQLGRAGCHQRRGARATAPDRIEGIVQIWLSGWAAYIAVQESRRRNGLARNATGPSSVSWTAVLNSVNASMLIPWV